MHVDGFRFDLAVALAREHGGFDRVSAFFDLVSQDPVVSRVKLIAEPWDVGQPDSYDLGRFPAQWSEWNGRYRDTVRDFWRGLAGTLPGPGDAPDRIGRPVRPVCAAGRTPRSTSSPATTASRCATWSRTTASTTRRTASRTRDGTDDNRSWNCGVEGPTDDPAVLALRARQSRALLATLLLSLGVPMLLGGDEMGRTQRGNNNAYCQDNEISWFDWGSADADLLGLRPRAGGHPAPPSGPAAPPLRQRAPCATTSHGSRRPDPP